MKSSSSLWLCDLACRKLTGTPLPHLPMWIIASDLDRLNKQDVIKFEKPELKSEDEIIIKGSRKKKWTKHILTKYRIKRAFRHR